MKIILLIIFLINLSFCVEIDTKLYDNKESQLYYKEIRKSIEKEERNKTKSIEIIRNEKKYLSKLLILSTKKIDIDNSKVQIQSDNLINDSYILQLITHLSEIKVKQNKQDTFSSNIQKKLHLLKKTIENSTESNKELLLYQLQFAYYKVQKNHFQIKKDLLKKKEEEVYSLILATIPKRSISKKEIDSQDIILKEKQIKQIIEKKVAFEIELESSYLDENEIVISKIKSNIVSINQEYQKNLIEKTDIIAKQIIDSLNKKNQKKYLGLITTMDNTLLNIDTQNKEIYTQQKYLFKSIGKDIFGNTDLFIETSLSYSKDYFKHFKNSFSKTLFTFNEKEISFLSLLKATLLIIIGFSVGIIYKKWLNKLSSNFPNMSQMSLKLTVNIGYYLIIVITLMVAMTSLGIDLSSISLIAGALSIGIGFGLQTVVSNFIAGIILMFERTIRIGDIVEINEILKGTVSDIRIRSTTIKTWDNIDIVVPNSSFIQNNVINWTLEDATRRIHIPFGVAYGTKVEKVKSVIIDELLKSNLNFIRNNEDKEPEIRFESMNSSSVDFELLVWVKANDRVQPNSLKSDFLILIYNTLYKHEIEIPFPQLDLHVKKLNKDADDKE